MWNLPERWLTIEPDSILHLTYEKHEPNIDLADFPRPFVSSPVSKTNDNKFIRPLFVLPDNPSSEDLSALMGLSFVLGQNELPLSDWEPEFVTAANFSSKMAPDRNVVLVGNPRTNMILAEYSQADSARKDAIEMGASPWDANHAIIVLSDNHPADGMVPTDTLADPVRSVLVRGNLAYADPALPASPPSLPEEMSLKDLGYTDRTVRGLGTKSLIYSLYLPYDVTVSNADISLHMVHSSAIDLSNSTANVYLNGYAIASILLSARSASLEPIEVSIPAERMRVGENFLRITFDFQPVNPTCEDNHESVWATIFNSSNLNILYRERSPLPDLRHYPQPFSDIGGTTIVVPDSLDQERLAYLAQLAARLGQQAHHQATPPRAKFVSEFDPEQLLTTHVILFGIPDENPIIMQVNDSLPLPFARDGKSLQQSFGIYVPDWTQNASFGLLEHIRSPWHAHGTVLVVTGNNAEGLRWASSILIDETAIGSINGNLVITGSDARDVSQRIVTQEAAVMNTLPQIGQWKLMGILDQPPPVLIAATTVIAILIVLGPISLVRILRQPIQHILIKRQRTQHEIE